MLRLILETCSKGGNEMVTPCDYGECPYDAEYSETCRVCCGLGVDEDEED